MKPDLFESLGRTMIHVGQLHLSPLSDFCLRVLDFKIIFGSFRSFYHRRINFMWPVNSLPNIEPLLNKYEWSRKYKSIFNATWGISI